MNTSQKIADIHEVLDMVTSNFSESYRRTSNTNVCQPQKEIYDLFIVAEQQFLEPPRRRARGPAVMEVDVPVDEDDLDEPVSKIVELVRLSSTFKTGCNRVAE